MERDLNSIIEPTVAIDLTAVSGAASVVGNIIDTEGYDGVDFIPRVDNYADGVFTPLVEDGDNAALSDAAAVDDDFLIGLESDAVLDADGVSHIGYVGKKRYVRLTLVATVGPTADVSADAILGWPRNAPTA